MGSATIKVLKTTAAKTRNRRCKAGKEHGKVGVKKINAFQLSNALFFLCGNGQSQHNGGLPSCVYRKTFRIKRVKAIGKVKLRQNKACHENCAAPIRR